MPDDLRTILHRAAGEFAAQVDTPPAPAVRARGDRRQRQGRAAGTMLVALVLLAGAGTGYLIARNQPSATPPASRPSPAPTPTVTASTSHPVTMLPAGKTGPRTAVPWSLIGPGWVLAEYTATTLPDYSSPVVSVTPGPTTLYLVDPLGGRYTMDTWPASGNQYWQLIDWSGDRTRALFEVSTTSGTLHVQQTEQLDLATGKLTTIPLPANAQAPLGYTLPHGENLLAITGPAKPARLERFDFAGTLQAVLASSSQLDLHPLSSPDGASYAVAASSGIQLISNSGRVIRKLPVPGATCGPVRWWDPATVLASCTLPAGTSQLWLVPADGSPPTALTQPRGGGVPGPDYGDVNAWQLPSGLYVQARSGCGGGFIARQSADRSVARVNVPGMTADHTEVLAVVSNRMLVEGHSGCQPGDSLVWFAPGAATVQPLLMARPGEQGVIGAIPFGELGG